MRYVLFSHLDQPAPLKIGDTVKRGQLIGKMGNTGLSSGAHLHTCITDRYPDRIYRLGEVLGLIDNLAAIMQEYAYFLDDELFGGPLTISTYWGDPTYFIKPKEEGKKPQWLFHPAYDVHPNFASDWSIFWTRSVFGRVHDKGYDHAHGNYLVIAY
jgi:hypothetical protein